MLLVVVRLIKSDHLARIIYTIYFNHLGSQWINCGVSFMVVKEAVLDAIAVEIASDNLTIIVDASCNCNN